MVPRPPCGRAPKDTLCVVSPNQPGMDFNNTSVTDFAKDQGLEGKPFLEDVPIADPAGLAQRLVQECGEGSGVVLNFTGPTVVPLLQAIDEQGLIDSVIWASSTPPNDPSVAEALSEDWNGKFLINAEFNVLDSGLPDNDLMLQLHEDAGADFPISSFAQMGYLVGRFTTEALLSIDGEITKESVNEAILNLKGMASDMLCKPWYYQNGSSANVSNNTDRTVTPQDGNMVSRRSASRSPNSRPTRWPRSDRTRAEFDSECRGPFGSPEGPLRVPTKYVVRGQRSERHGEVQCLTSNRSSSSGSRSVGSTPCLESDSSCSSARPAC